MILLAVLLACSGDTLPEDTAPDTTPVSLRVATFNVSLFGSEAGEVVRRLEGGADPQAQGAAAILQRVAPDLVLLNELDSDDGERAAELFVTQYLEVPQADDLDGLDGFSWYTPTSNTGVASGVDLDNDGRATTTPGSREYGNDSFGYGEYAGQYGLSVLSRYPIIDTRTFQTLKWSDMPENRMPTDYYSADAQAVLRLSSKTHADVTVEIEGIPLHFLVSHPTPPGFDGSEDRNGRRNADEIRFWAEYIEDAAWLVDDQGGAGGLASGNFVIAGDLNADPVDGDSFEGAIQQLLEHARIVDPAPESLGAAEQGELQANANTRHQGPHATDTADFSDSSVGNLRIDYVLPSAEVRVEGSGVFWPAQDDPDFQWVGTEPFPVSDHRLVWVDLTLDE